MSDVTGKAIFINEAGDVSRDYAKHKNGERRHHALKAIAALVKADLYNRICIITACARDEDVQRRIETMAEVLGSKLGLYADDRNDVELRIDNHTARIRLVSKNVQIAIYGYDQDKPGSVDNRLNGPCWDLVYFDEPGRSRASENALMGLRLGIMPLVLK